MMRAADHAKKRVSATRILESELAPLEKVRRLVALGYDEEAADEIVTGAAIGPAQGMYYEQLPRPDYEK